MKPRDYLPENQFVELVTNHLRKISRKVMKVDTRDEILQFLANTFINALNCDFVAIGMIDGDQLSISNLSGDFEPLKEIFPYPVDKINPILFEKSMMSTEPAISSNSPIRKIFDREEITSWFTMPIADDTEIYGLAIVGYHKETVLYQQMQTHLDEFGTYIGIALNLIKRNQSKERAMLDISYLSNSFTEGNSLAKLVDRVVTMAGKETTARTAALFLFNDERNELSLVEPTFGFFTKKDKVTLSKDNLLESYFPNVEKFGDHQITIPLTVEMEMIGVLYVEKTSEQIFTSKHLDTLQMYANYFSVIYENVQLNLKEKHNNNRLKKILKVQQQLVRKTVENDGFTELNHYFSRLLNSSIILFDRFFNVMEYALISKGALTHEQIIEAATKVRTNQNLSQSSFMMNMPQGEKFEVMAINDGQETHAYIAIETPLGTHTELLALTINMLNNIYSIQFNKRKLEWRAHEQIKDTFVQQLLVPEIQSLDPLLEYASVFQWNLYSSHRVAVISLKTDEALSKLNVLEQKTTLNRMLDYLKELIKNFNPAVITSMINDKLVVFTPIQKVSSKIYWQNLMEHLLTEFKTNGFSMSFVLAVGGKAKMPEEYYESYQKALHTANVLLKHPQEKPLAFFDDMGSYTVLNWLKESPSSLLFMRHYLQELFTLSMNQQLDLYETLRHYLEANGNVTATADRLYLHRSTLNYRLQRIKDVLTIDIDDANERFNLMLAYKLADLHDDNIFQVEIKI